MSASAESILELYTSTLNRRPHRQRTYIKRTTARLSRQLFSPPNSSPPYHHIYINAVVTAPCPHDLPTDRTQPKTLRTRRTRPLTLASFPPHFHPHPSSHLLSPLPKTSRREKRGRHLHTRKPPPPRRLRQQTNKTKKASPLDGTAVM